MIIMIVTSINADPRSIRGSTQHLSIPFLLENYQRRFFLKCPVQAETNRQISFSGRSMVVQVLIIAIWQLEEKAKRSAIEIRKPTTIK